MNIRRTALFLATAIGAGLGAAVIIGPVAQADESNSPVTIDEFTTGWPWSSGHLTSTETITSIPGIYRDSESTFDYTTYDENWVDVIGHYDTKLDSQSFGGFPLYYNTSSEVVTDSSDAAPPVGTTWDASNFGFGTLVPQAFTDLYENYSLSIPDGITAHFWDFMGIGNEFVTGPDGTTDFLFFYGDFIPIFDIPAG